MRKILPRWPAGVLLLVAFAATAGAQSRPTSASVRLDSTLSTGSTQPGDNFTATLDSPLVVNDRIVAERGERVQGRRGRWSAQAA